MIKILFLTANPSDGARLRLDAESRAIDQVLREAEYRDKFQIQQHWAVRVTDLQGLMLRHQPNIVHFSGHGSAESELILEDNLGNSQVVSSGALSQLFSVLKDNIRCVVLNACYSESQAQAIAQHIDCVVGMSDAIEDTSAISFATSFYQALGFGRDVQTAFDLGCLQIDMENLGQEDVPQLVAIKCQPSQMVFVNSQTESVAREATDSQGSGLDGSKGKHTADFGGVKIGNISGGITGSIIAGRDVTNTTVKSGAHSVDVEPSLSNLKQLLAEIQREIAEIMANQAALNALSPANRRNVQGAEDNVKEAARKVHLNMAQDEAATVQEYLAEAADLMSGVLDKLNMVAQKASDDTGTVQPLLEKNGPLPDKVRKAAMWAGQLQL